MNNNATNTLVKVNRRVSIHVLAKYNFMNMKSNLKISEITDQKIFLTLTEEIKGYIPKKDFINSSYNEDPELGDEIEVVIASINNKDREIILSLRALEIAQERDALRDNAEKNKQIEESSKSNLGDMIKAEIVEKEDE